MDFKNLLFLLIILIPKVHFGQTDSFPKNGEASYYHPKFQGRETSSGEEYNQNDFTAAHRTLPFNSIVHVTNKQNNKSVVVRINDRGPFKKSRIIDLTRSAAKKLDMIPFGVVPVKIQPLTYLDKVEFSDSLFSENEIWDCFAKKVELNDSAIYVWKTKSAKHAFYMASDLLLDYQLNDVFVKVTGNEKERTYLVIIPKPGDFKKTVELVATLRRDGFQFAKTMLSD